MYSHYHLLLCVLLLQSASCYGKIRNRRSSQECQSNYSINDQITVEKGRVNFYINPQQTFQALTFSLVIQNCLDDVEDLPEKSLQYYMFQLKQWNMIQLSVDTDGYKAELNGREILSDSKNIACYKVKGVKVTIEGRSYWSVACDPRVPQETSTAIFASQPSNRTTASENHITASSSSLADVSLSTERSPERTAFRHGDVVVMRITLACVVLEVLGSCICLILILRQI